MAATRQWHVMDAEAVARQLSVDPSTGLDAEQVSQRRAEHGPNAFATHRRAGWLRMVGNQFRDFMILVLIAAAVISGVVGEARDAIAILVIVVLNAAVGVFQEYRAERALEALRSLVLPTTQVRRAGRTKTIPTRDLVPGDIVLVESGDRVPADIRRDDGRAAGHGFEGRESKPLVQRGPEAERGTGLRLDVPFRHTERKDDDLADVFLAELLHPPHVGGVGASRLEDGA